jgi:hypothetical protein
MCQKKDQQITKPTVNQSTIVDTLTIRDHIIRTDVVSSTRIVPPTTPSAPVQVVLFKPYTTYAMNSIIHTIGNNSGQITSSPAQ